jgi:Helix-turn-helix domain
MPGKRLSLEERRVIENCLIAGLTQKQIAAALGRSPSTICRELARNHNWWYRPSSPLRIPHGRGGWWPTDTATGPRPRTTAAAVVRRRPVPRASIPAPWPVAPDDQFIDVPRAVPADDVAERVVRLVGQLPRLRSLIVFVVHRRPWARPRQSVILCCLYFGRAATDKRLQPVE